MKNSTIRSKVIFGIIIFTLLLFGWTELRHDTILKQQVVNAESSHNRLLIETIMPILELNLAFGLEEASRHYLTEIVSKNPNILMMKLENESNRVLFVYHRKDVVLSEATKISKIEKRINDRITEHKLGRVEVHFSNHYYQLVIKENLQLRYEFFIIVIIVLALFVLLLHYLFLPLKILTKQLQLFDPHKNRFPLKRTEREDEVGVIQNSVIDMVERIRLYTDKLDDFTKNLELKVEDRTEQLRLKTEKLESKILQVKEQEEMLISQSRLAAMGEMMSMIAHQWRQPLSTTTLMITNYNLKSLLANHPRDERDDILQKISETLIYLSDTVDDFQTYFKPETHTEETSVISIVQKAVQFTESRLAPYGIELEIKCDELLHIQTFVNELVQVLINIINNAVDALKESGVERKKIMIETEEKNQEVLLSISDNGGGISEEMIEKVFEPYYSTKGKNGTGLGLYMAKMIINKHAHGKISVNNSLHGAVFTITFKKTNARSLKR
ncbi:MAG: hypothetical protein DRG24_05540 [Epsilonproteobacteria bacterium]|nr:MAG: hypothetical protein DRG24_05540 [Campylobacterota bacterium]